MRVASESSPSAPIALAIRVALHNSGSVMAQTVALLVQGFANVFF